MVAGGFLCTGTCYLITHLPIICRASQKSWDDFFLIVETIDEKQVHLVKQVVPRLCGLYGNGDVDLQPSWVLVIFEILFVHQVSEEKVFRTAIALIPFRHILHDIELCHRPLEREALPGDVPPPRRLRRPLLPGLPLRSPPRRPQQRATVREGERRPSRPGAAVVPRRHAGVGLRPLLRQVEGDDQRLSGMNRIQSILDGKLYSLRLLFFSAV